MNTETRKCIQTVNVFGDPLVSKGDFDERHDEYHSDLDSAIGEGCGDSWNDKKWCLHHEPRWAEETPLDRNLREVREAFAKWEETVRDCRNNGASPEEIKRCVIALETLKHELADMDLYSENA